MKLSHLHLKASLDNSDVQTLIKLAAPTLKSVKTTHSVDTEVLLRLEASQLEELNVGQLGLRQAVSLLSSKPFTALTSIVFQCDRSEMETSKQLLDIVASLSPPRLEKVWIRFPLQLQADELLPYIYNVAKSHSQTLRTFSVDCHVTMAWNNVQETCLALFNLPPHRIRLHQTSVFGIVLKANATDKLVWNPIAGSLFDQIIAPISSARDQARELYRALCDLAHLIFHPKTDTQPFLDWVLLRLEAHRLIDPLIVGRDLALRIVGILALCTKPPQKSSACLEIHEAVQPILERFRGDESRVAEFVFRSPFWVQRAVVDVPFWKKLLIQNLKSPSSVLRRVVTEDDQFYDVQFFIELLSSETVDLWIQNEQGCTLIDQILVEYRYSATQLLEMILSNPSLNAQLFQRLSAQQLERIYSGTWIHHTTSVDTAHLFPARLFEIIQEADSDATLEAVFAFYYRRIRYIIAMESDKDVVLSEEKQEFVDLFGRAIPFPLPSAEQRIQRFLSNVPPFHTLGDKY
jgi:hypothetical protein